MNKGYVSLYREIEENWLWFAEPFTKAQAWIDLIMLANHKETCVFIRGNKVEVKRGQVVWSKENLAQRWKWSRKKVLNFLKVLEKEQQITQQKMACIVVLEIVNYNKYQKKEQQKNNRRTTEEQQKNTNNNDNNDNNDNNPPTPQKGEEVFLEIKNSVDLYYHLNLHEEENILTQRLNDVAPNWCKLNLCEKYFSWIKDKERPKNLEGAFLGWAKSFTKQKSPQ